MLCHIRCDAFAYRVYKPLFRFTYCLACISIRVFFFLSLISDHFIQMKYSVAMVVYIVCCSGMRWCPDTNWPKCVRTINSHCVVCTKAAVRYIFPLKFHGWYFVFAYGVCYVVISCRRESSFAATRTRTRTRTIFFLFHQCVFVDRMVFGQPKLYQITNCRLEIA